MSQVRSILNFAVVVTFALVMLWTGTENASAVNLVPNGNFELGNSLFTSDYAHSPAGNSTEGQYTVRSNPFPWNSAFVSIGDHTTGTGLMYVGNGAPVAGSIVWQSSAIAVDAATQYFFESFVNNVCCQNTSFGPGSESILEFSLSFNGGAAQSLGTIITDLALAGTWEGLSTNWTSGIAGSVVLSLINQNTNRGGNDFAIDDIHFGVESVVNPDPTVPEPATLGLLGIGLMAMGARKHRKSKS